VKSLLKRLKIRNVIIILLVLGLVGGYYVKSQKKNDQLVSTTVKKGDLEENLILSGEIKTHEDVTLRFQTGGRLARLYVQEGDVVKKGQLVASLDQRQVKKQLDKELNDFLTSRWDLDQERDDAEDKAVTDAIRRLVDKAQFDVNNAVIDVELQNLTIEFSNIYSPINGIVVNTNNIHDGMNILPATDTIEVAGPDSLYFELTADQTEVTQLSEAMSGELLLDSYLDEPIKGAISSISFSPKKDETGTVYTVKFNIERNNSSYKYRLGMTGDVTFTTETKKNVLYIPFTYVNEENDGKFVYILEKNKKTQQKITTGIETEDSIEVVSGLSEGEVIYD